MTTKTVIKPKPGTELSRGERVGTAEVLHRAPDDDMEDNGGDEFRLTLSCSSEVPFLRYLGWDIGRAFEVLGHQDGEADISRAMEPQRMPLLVDHDNRVGSIVGTIERAWLEDGRLMAEARLGNHEKAREVRQQLEDGVLSNVSISYSIRKMVLEEEKDDAPSTYRVTDWELFEVSLVAVPADPTVGLGRSDDQSADEGRQTQPGPEAPQPRRTVAMTTPTQTTETTDAPVETQPRAAEVGTPAPSVADLMAVGRAHPDVQGIELAAAVIEAGGDEADLRKRIADAYRALQEREADEQPEAREYERRSPHVVVVSRALPDDVQVEEMNSTPYDIGMSERDIRNFSIARAFAKMHERAQGKNTSCAEIELMHAAADRVKKVGERTVEGAYVLPEEVFRAHQPIASREAAKRAMTSGAAATGGNLVADDFLAGSFIEYLYDQSVVLPLATILDNLVGNVEIPKQTGTATVRWLAETTTTGHNPADIDTGQVTLSPNRLQTSVEYSYTLLNQGTPSVEQFVRADMAMAMTLAIDDGLINGTDANNQPKGILAGITNAASNLVTKGNNGGAPTWKDVVDLETLVASDNALMGNLCYIAPAALIGKLKTTEKASDTAQFLYDTRSPEMPLNGYPVKRSNQVPNGVTKGTGSVSTLLFGNFNDVIFGRWGGTEFIVNPYSGDVAGTIRITARTLADVAVRHQESFAACKDFTVV